MHHHPQASKAFALGLALVACAEASSRDAHETDASASGDGGGGGVGGAAGVGASPGVGPGGAPATSGSGAAGGAPESECMEYSGIGLQVGRIGVLTPSSGGTPDVLGLRIPPGATGTYQLQYESSYTTCAAEQKACVELYAEGKQFLAVKGTFEVTASDVYYATATMTDVELVEIVVPRSGQVIKVPDGLCARIPSLEFHSEPPAPGWTCTPMLYDELGLDQALQTGFDPMYMWCDCACGAFDPDCNNPQLLLEDLTNFCPPGWTCSPTYDGCIEP